MGTAGLASAETLDDGDKEKNNVVASAAGEDGMETVRLDGGEAADGNPPNKPGPIWTFIADARRNMMYTGKRWDYFRRYVINMQVYGEDNFGLMRKI